MPWFLIFFYLYRLFPKQIKFSNWNLSTMFTLLSPVMFWWWFKKQSLIPLSISDNTISIAMYKKNSRYFFSCLDGDFKHVEIFDLTPLLVLFPCAKWLEKIISCLNEAIYLYLLMPHQWSKNFKINNRHYINDSFKPPGNCILFSKYRYGIRG